MNKGICHNKPRLVVVKLCFFVWHQYFERSAWSRNSFLAWECWEWMQHHPYLFNLPRTNVQTLDVQRVVCCHCCLVFFSQEGLLLSMCDQFRNWNPKIEGKWHYFPHQKLLYKMGYPSFGDKPASPLSIGELPAYDLNMLSLLNCLYG